MELFFFIATGSHWSSYMFSFWSELFIMHRHKDNNTAARQPSVMRISKWMQVFWLLNVFHENETPRGTVSDKNRFGDHIGNVLKMCSQRVSLYLLKLVRDHIGLYELPRCIKSHLYHVVFISKCNVFYPFYVRFYHCTACTVYFHCLRVRLLRVTLIINQSITNLSAPLRRN